MPRNKSNLCEIFLKTSEASDESLDYITKIRRGLVVFIFIRKQSPLPGSQPIDKLYLRRQHGRREIITAT